MVGILTTIGASRLDYWQAAALGRALEQLKDSPPLAVLGRACDISGLARHCWQEIATEDPLLQRGFESKLHLYRHSPFDETLFLDSDILPARREVSFEEFVGPLRAARGPVAYFAKDCTEGPFQGSEISSILRRIDAPYLPCTIGGGHYFWKKGSESEALFQRAAQISEERWPEVSRFKPALGKSWHTPDEVVVAIAAAEWAGRGSAEMPSTRSIAKSQKGITDDKAVSFVHYLGDKHPSRYLQQCLAVTGNPFLALVVTINWFRHMSRKTYHHHRAGGRRRIKMASAAESDLSH